MCAVDDDRLPDEGVVMRNRDGTGDCDSGGIRHLPQPIKKSRVEKESSPPTEKTAESWSGFPNKIPNFLRQRGVHTRAGWH
ncbi:hypothetical protein MJO28_007808 [Puccinia striiformis f. sp. tritici]|uniref:Uncharacterized protein n=1 Tax=Puccinia striiformis f. sp. tritici TaxID=168172 RepID=A0ACC0EHA3_9BASI|nr:hypothetical protein MJO28_007808 [Puccinia striiformis f. sp. tritici]